MWKLNHDILRCLLKELCITYFLHTISTYSLTGKVLAVGGIKEKVMAARRAGIKTIVLPEDCRRDFDELPDYLKEGIDINYATDYSDVFEVAFGSN